MINGSNEKSKVRNSWRKSLICIACVFFALGVIAVFKIARAIEHGTRIHERAALSIIHAVSTPEAQMKLEKWLDSKIPNYFSSKSLSGSKNFYDFDYGILGLDKYPDLGGVVTFQYSSSGDFENVHIPFAHVGLIITQNQTTQILSRHFTVWNRDKYYVYFQADPGRLEELRHLIKSSRNADELAVQAE